ncbi:uncharacterized protein LOC124927586 [Impatiens glandulifera]|uniref:uncharacterized protein LOC124927586 n=1 Tax=Impatiens glandulifera TaxID=253017 RepID=UPI001FB0E9C9|nr:uncharacterized protein LOC124927586 [Impatiens glandulifera]
MSGGSPMGGGFVRQRHSYGYSSGGEELDEEDDACSRFRPQPPFIQLTRSWTEIIENLLWIVSAIFIFYYGDGNSNFFYLLWHDHRIKRIVLYIGMGGISLNSMLILYMSMVAWKVSKCGEKWDIISNSSSGVGLPFIAFIGVTSFCLLSFALWPIWSLLTLPLLFTLFMTGGVTVPYLIILLTSRTPTEVLRID